MANTLNDGNCERLSSSTLIADTGETNLFANCPHFLSQSANIHTGIAPDPTAPTGL